ncbi:MAG: hypothetical protein LBC82_07660 [Oscillospiraceae bacterium]|nr:hypothetical protein [Oscillospiraceae bacterium]
MLSLSDYEPKGYNGFLRYTLFSCFVFSLIDNRFRRNFVGFDNYIILMTAAFTCIDNYNVN